ncbi:GRAS domain family [Musa troglodytarum]|uniref:GRAS domain family n=1 Tax=Musa troglodytarum TaxID=320322 RepID=A0A9E7I6W4_9LILI|nr:GRAS domain family [Musa troglodytarum]
MMQFTRSAPPLTSIHPNGLGLCLDDDASKHSLHRSWPWPWSGLLTSSKSLGRLNTASCMEQLLVHCANAIESNDATLAQQILWVLNNIAPPDGDSNQRLTSAFLRALIARASKTGSCKMLTAVAARADADLALHLHRFSAIDLASFIDLTPWHRFGYAAANAAIVEAVEGLPVVHIIDLSTTHCMQVPTLIDLLANRPEGPPFIRLTVPTFTTTATPPMLDMSYDELGSRLVNFARSRNVAMEFIMIPSDPSDAFDSLIEHLRVQRLVSEGEAVIVNCQMLLHYIPEETVGAIVSTMNVNSPIPSLRTMFLKALRSLEPTLVTLVDEDADFTACDVVGRLRSAFNYLWIPYDAVDTFLPKGSEQRRWYEAGLCWKIENVIAQEGLQRVERQEPKGRWGQRMRAAGFRSVGFTEEAAREVNSMLGEHAAGWGSKREDEDLMLTWKGHNVVFASAWMPS